MTDKVVYKTPTGAEVQLSVSIVRDMLTNKDDNFTDTEIMQFIELCKYNGVNPFLKEGYLMRIKGKCTFVPSKELFQKRAEMNPDYDGSKSGIFVQRGKEIVKVVGTMMLQGDILLGGWAEVYRKSQKIPVEITVSIAEYNQDNFMWKSKPATMIRKVALMQGLREAFTNALGCMYTQEEQGIEDADAVVVASETPKQAAPQQQVPQNGQQAAIEPPKDDKCFKGVAKVKTHLVNNNIKGAMDGLDWLKANYPDKDFSELQKMVDAKVNAIKDI